jgi:hypothetical protein
VDRRTGLAAVAVLAAALGALAAVAHAAALPLQGLPVWHPPCPWLYWLQSSQQNNAATAATNNTTITATVTDYVAKAVDIVRNDPETADLLDKGYTIVNVRPLVEAQWTSRGPVATPTSQAIVVLVSWNTLPPSKAFVTVDLDQGKVVNVAYWP